MHFIHSNFTKKVYSYSTCMSVFLERIKVPGIYRGQEGALNPVEMNF